MKCYSQRPAYMFLTGRHAGQAVLPATQRVGTPTPHWRRSEPRWKLPKTLQGQKGPQTLARAQGKHPPILRRGTCILGYAVLDKEFRAASSIWGLQGGWGVDTVGLGEAEVQTSLECPLTSLS